MQTLYPAIKPYKTHKLKVDSFHTLYLEETGDPDGIPVIVLHDGPGAGGDPTLRRFFDPEKYRIIIFDQRGSGRSTPHALIKNNTTDLLIEDIKAIRAFLKLSQLMLFGMGWGGLLALIYAEKYPNEVQILLLQGVSLGRSLDIDWLYRRGANCIYPDFWQEFISFCPLSEREDVVECYTTSLEGENELARMSAAKHWALWYARLCCLHVHVSFLEEQTAPHVALSLATIQSYYVKHHFFLHENQVLNQIYQIKAKTIPTYLIHGRYDMVCPLINAEDLHRELPTSQLNIIREAGHSYHEASIVDALITATKQISYENSN